MMKPELLSNIDLTHLAKILGIKLNGIYFTKALKDLSVQIINGCYIFNLAPDITEGKHWTCMIVKNNKICYYDSFGIVPSQDIIDFIKSQKRKFKFICSQNPSQNFYDTSCGYYCLSFLYAFTHYPDISYFYLNEFNKMFVENTKLNIEKLQEYFKKIIPSNYIITNYE